MNPDTNKFEPLRETTGDDLATKAEQLRRRLPPKYTHAGEAAQQALAALGGSLLLRPNGEPVPVTWTQFKVGETVVIKSYTFRVAYIGETAILFEPVGPVVVAGER